MWEVIWSAQPGLAAATASASVASRFSALRRPSSAAGSGLKRLYTPAEPQQISQSAGSTSSSSGMPRSSARGCERTPWAWARWQASW